MDENQDAMNLDLNLGPVVHPDGEDGNTVTMNLEEWLNSPVHIIREAIRQREAGRLTRADQRRRYVLNHEYQIVAAGSAVETGEGSVTAEERPIELTKTCENPNGVLRGELADTKDDEKVNGGDDGSFFDCNICLDLAKDPVVTCCGHLFCWPCIYRWIHVHSEAKECPICKGEVSIKNVTPIYGRGNTSINSDEDPNLKIPVRPQARWVDSWRQTIQRNTFDFPVEEMIRSLDNHFESTHDLARMGQVHPPVDGARRLPERSNLLLNRILTSRGMRREQNQNENVSVPSDEVIDLTGTNPSNSDASENPTRRHSSLLHRRSRPAGNISPHTFWAHAERIVESYFRGQNVGRSSEAIPVQAVDDRDSVSSIAAVIQSESQTVDTAVEIDSTISHSTSSSRRRHDTSTSRVSDVDSGDSRPDRRRRLNSPN